MKKATSIETVEELRKQAYLAFKNCCIYEKPTNEDTVPNPKFFNYLDAEMIEQLQNEQIDIPPYLIEQARHLSTYRTLEEALGCFGEPDSDSESSDKIIPVGSLKTFIYDSDVYSNLIALGNKQNHQQEEDIVQKLYREEHNVIDKKAELFIEKQKKKNPSWRKSSHRFSLYEVSQLRAEFLESCNIAPETKNKKPRILTIWSQKGGVGKTHVSVSLAGALALTSNKNYKVLLVDADFQGSSSLCINPEYSIDEHQRKSVFDLLEGYAHLDASVEDITEFRKECVSSIIPSSIPNIDLLPSDKLSAFDTNYTIGVSQGRKTIKSNALKYIIDNICTENHYDFVLIDTRPDTGTSASLAYFACSEQIMVVKPSGTDINAFKNFCFRLAVNVIPKLVSKDYTSPIKHRLIVNQFVAGSTNKTMVDFLELALEGGMIDVMDIIIPNSTATTLCSGESTTIWNPSKGLVPKQALKAQRFPFQSIAARIVSDEY